MTAAAPQVEISHYSGYGYVTATETAKLVRYWLKVTFPGTRFRVTTSKGSLSHSLDIYWADGPLKAEVDTLVRPFVGTGFDGMQDIQTHNEAWLFPDGSAQRFVSGIGSSYGATVRDGQGAQLDEHQCHDYMAGLLLAWTGETTRRNYDAASDAFKLGQADAAAMREKGAELVTFHSDHIFTHREFSPAARTRLEQAVVFLSGFGGAFEGTRQYDFGLNGRAHVETGYVLARRLGEEDPATVGAAIAEEAQRRAIRDCRQWNEQARGNQQARGETGPGVAGYYVTAQDAGKTSFLLGPYATHGEAEADVRAGRDLAISVNDRAGWYAYGTTRITRQPGDDLEPGILEKLPARQLALAFPEPAAAVTP